MKLLIRQKMSASILVLQGSEDLFVLSVCAEKREGLRRFPVYFADK